MQNWAKEGLIVSLNENIKADGVDLSKYAGMDACYVALTDGEQYALPFRADYWVMFYNKDLFAAAGIEKLPATFAEVLEAAEKISALGNDANGNLVRWFRS